MTASACLILFLSWGAVVQASPGPELIERFRGGRNTRGWIMERTGTCGPGTTEPSAPRHLDDRWFRKGSAALTAVSGSTDAPPPLDECMTMLKLAPIQVDGDFEAKIVFRLDTEQSGLVVNLKFARGTRALALMLPAENQPTAPGIPPGRAAFLCPDGDLALDNPALKRGTRNELKVSYACASNSARIFLNGRPLSSGGKSELPVPKTARPGEPALLLYTEAQLRPPMKSKVVLEAIRLSPGAPCR